MTLKGLAFLVCILAIAAAASAQTTQDPQAVAILIHSLNAAGGISAVNAIQDYTGAGNITYSWADASVQAPATIQSMGVTTFRIDSILSDGTRTWAVDGFAGVLIAPDGTRLSS